MSDQLSESNNENNPQDAWQQFVAQDAQNASQEGAPDVSQGGVPPTGTSYADTYGTPGDTPPAVPVQAYYVDAAGQPYYPMSESDRTLRLVAFIFNLLSLIGSCWLVIPLAWMIPMCLISWKIYKGTRPNTTAFGVCDLIFCSLVGGILLLCTKKEA